MITLERTSSENLNFVLLVRALDKDLQEKDGPEHTFYAQFNKIDQLKNVIVAYADQEPIGCGAIKAYNEDTCEIKRMFVSPEVRGKGIATQILKELERWSQELDFNKCILETGKKQPDAIALYKKNGYQIIENYGQYQGVENSVCFEKILNTDEEPHH